MKELQSKQKLKKIMYSTPVLVAVFLLVAVLARGAWGVLNKERTSREATQELITKSENLKSREQELKKNIRELETEEGIREEIRAKFNVAEEGESFIVLVDHSETEVTPATSTRPLFEKWWNGLKNLWQ